MKKITARLTFIRTLLTTCLLLASSSLFAATDTDGDGILDNTQGWVVVTGSSHACVLYDVGVLCWGDSTNGKTVVPVLSNPTQISAGGGHTCALDDNGVHCWGSDSQGNSNVPALANPIQISAGGTNTCAIDDTGVVCWGENGGGQNNVPMLNTPTQVSAGNSHTCALDATGVHCWGDNTVGQITVPTLSNPVAVIAGGEHTCALDDTGVVCWGSNYFGQTDVPALSNPTQISAGYYHTCATDNNGVHCWGASNDSSLVAVPALVHPTQVSTGTNVTCALDVTSVRCWGNSMGAEAKVIPAALATDNCPQEPNNDQADDDGDHLGDACDPLPLDADALNTVDNEAKAEKFGSVVVYVGDFNGDHFGDWAVGTPRYDIPAAPPLKAVKDAGQVKIISGNSGEVLAHFDGTVASENFGTALAGNADVNGDGFMDVVVGSPLADNPTALPKPLKDVGAVTVIYGCTGIDCATTDDRLGSTVKTGFGSAVALGDVDDDGKADVVVGEPKATNDQGEKPLKQAGKVIVLSGADLSAAPLLTVYGQTAGALAGTVVAAGDFNGTGGAEVVVGAPKDDDTTVLPKPLKDAGSVNIYTNGSITPIYTQYGAAANLYFGTSVAANADVNKDGVKDVLVGEPGWDDTASKLKDVGAAVVLYGSNSGNYSRSTDKIGTEAAAKLGTAVALGDVNADGYADLILSAPKGDNTNTLPKPTKDTGSVQVFSGNGFTALGNTQYGAAKGDAFGTSISVGDINADGKVDIIVGIPSKDVTVNIDGKDKVQKDAGSASILNATAL